MPYVRIWVHAVWGTKNRFPFLTKQIREKLIDHICENAKLKGIYIDSINGFTDHLHVLISLDHDMSIAEAVKLIKGESAFWMNKNHITTNKFEWAQEYYAASVDESRIEVVRNYIDRQEEHHHRKTFQEEYNEFLKAFSFLQAG
ncbi:MAG TPA: IS200/IS605 family transposase [Bacteroidia bacterium]|nr:IS200/IS605 family transposase [Bacteroidia bacterium]